MRSYCADRHHEGVFRRPALEPQLSDDEVRGLITIVMRIDQRTAEMHSYLLEEGDDEEEEGT